MSSSTSSSEPAAAAPPAPRAPLVDRRVALGVLLVVAVLELFTRVRLFEMSKDFRRFRGYDARAAALEATGGTRLALIGNSATDRGVDVKTLETALGGGGGPPPPPRLLAHPNPPKNKSINNHNY
jgi:hypothetical protein